MTRVGLFRLAVCAVASFAVANQAAAQVRAQGPAKAFEIEVVAAESPAATKRDAAPDLARYTVDWVRRKARRKATGQTARLVPGQALPFLPPANLIEMTPVWERAGHSDWILIGRGQYTLASLAEQLDDPEILTRQRNGVYLLRRPIYVAPTGSLTVSKGETLRMSSPDGAILISNGRVVIVDSTVVAWDPRRNATPKRPDLDKTEARLWSTNEVRPYLLFQNGSETWIGNSALVGLGYMGGYGSYGLSFSATLGEKSLNRHIQTLNRPRGWLIGNRIKDFFFGVYSNRVRDLVIVGNDFDGNLIYGIDPHDHSRGVIIARNVARRSAHSHGIIISRDVSKATIADNISINNAGSGIVLDRQSRDVRVSGNIAMTNGGDGVSLFESGDAKLTANHVLLNRRNGIYARNSVDLLVAENEISQNGDDGVEVAAFALKPGSRDLELDPYEALMTARLRSNEFRDNANSAISAKGVSELSVSGNRYVDSGPLYFGGELKRVGAKILQLEPEDESSVLVIREPRGASK